MINFEKIQDDNVKNKIAEDRWKIDLSNDLNDTLVSILETKYGIEFIQYEDDIFVPMNLTYIGGDGFSSVYRINNNDDIVIKVTNEESEIKFAKELIRYQEQKTNIDYINYFVKSQMLIPSNISTINHTEDYYERNNVYIILEKLNNLTDNEIKLVDDFDEYHISITGYPIFQDFDGIDIPRFNELIQDFIISTFLENDYINIDFMNNFDMLYSSVVDIIIENKWFDFNIKNIMKDNNNNLKIIDLQTN